MKAFKLRNTERRSQEKCAEKCAIRKPLKMEQPEIDHGSTSLTMTRHADRSRSVNDNNSSGKISRFPGKNHFLQRARADAVAVFLKQVIPGNALLFIARMFF